MFEVRFRTAPLDMRERLGQTAAEFVVQLFRCDWFWLFAVKNTRVPASDNDLSR
jgi:hypothetical protein